MCTSRVNRPLYIDPEVEARGRPSKLSAFQQTAKWLHAHLPFVLYYELPRGRRSIADQLIHRECFATELWKAYGNTDTIVATLKVLQAQRNWPVHYFIPDDSLMLALIPECSDEVATTVFYTLNNIFHVRYGDDEIGSLLEQDPTVGDFVRDFLRRYEERGMKKGVRTI